MAKRILIDNEQTNENTQATMEQSSTSSTFAKEQLTVENKVTEGLSAATIERTSETQSCHRRSRGVGNKENPEDRYAHMFADWDLLPPQVLIRRVSRK